MTRRSKISTFETSIPGGKEIPFLLLMLWVFSACEKGIHWQLEPNTDSTIVVDARITNEFKIQQLQLTYPFGNLNENPVPCSLANVKITRGSQTIHFSESPQLPGTYLSNVPFAATVENSYHLTIEKEDQRFEAETYMVPVLPFESPEFIFHAERGLYSIKWNNGKYSPFEQAMYEAEIEWNHLPGYDHPDSIARAQLRLYTLSTIDVSYIIFPQNEESVYFPEGSIVYFSKYSLNNEYGAYLRALLSETQWQGSLFETARANLPGNISNEGWGYFSTCAVIRDTLLVE